MNKNNYRKTGLFFGLSTLIPWILWLLAGHISNRPSTDFLLTKWVGIIAFLGLLAPVIIAISLVWGNKEEILDLKSRFFNFNNVPSTYIVLALFLMPFSILLAQAVSLLFGYSIEQFQLAGSYSFSSGVFPVWLMLFIAPVLEELAWHSYGTDSLHRRYNIFTTSILFAMFWGIWHLPCASIKDYYHSKLLEEGWVYSFNFLLSLFPFVMIMNWIYYKTNRNILLPIVFHVGAGFFNEIFATHPISKVIQTGLLSLFACYIIVNDKAFFFAKEQKPNRSKTKAITKLGTLYLGVGFIALAMLSLGATSRLFAQEITHHINGKVFDGLTHEPLPFASIVLKGSDPLVGTVSDIHGNFVLERVRVGRHSISISMVGYGTYEIKEHLVSSGGVADLNIGLLPSNTQLGEVIVRVSKSTPLNNMATLSSRQFTVEETQRYAGGMDDPARLVSSFAGVTNPSISDNGISVRGNNPDGLLWRIDGVEVPSPNHFANLSVAGGGLLSAISSQMMGNSDFFTGAFPAEYGNASSGVFDINLRNGDRYKRRYAFKAGVLGMEAMAEGPFRENKGSTYIVNYRNSTMALLAPLLPDDAGILKYQDLSFKTSFPMKKYGKLTVWGIATIDGVKSKAIDSNEWESDFDRDNSKTSMYMYAGAVSHKITLPGNAFLKSTASVTGSGLSFAEERLAPDLRVYPQSNATNSTNSITVQSELTVNRGEKHVNKSGFRYTHSLFNLDVKKSLASGMPPSLLANQTGNTGLIQLFSQSKVNLSPNLELNAGVNGQYLLLNKGYSIEPRLGMAYQIDNNQSLGFAYGIHSRMEQLSVYFAMVNDSSPNTKLDLAKSSHYVFSYKLKLTDNVHLTIEPYYQHLNKVPVASRGYVSTLNNSNNLFFNHALVSEGKGKNIGVDFMLERYLSKGYYYMVTASLFDSKYTGADGIERNTLFNRNYVFNLMTGKEWQIRKNNILSANIRLNYLGGNRIEPIDIAASLQRNEVVYGETGGDLAFAQKHDALPVLSSTISYRINRTKYSSVWSLQILNATGTKEYSKDFYNLKTKRIDTKYDGVVIPNLSYKIEF